MNKPESSFKKAIVYLSLLTCCLFSCSKENENIPEPLQKLTAGYSNCECEPFIDEYVRQNEVVYLFSCKGIACNCVTNYYNENGDPLTMDSAYSPDDFRKESRFVKNVWSCK